MFMLMKKKMKVSITKLSYICKGDLINISDMSQVSPINTKDLLTNKKMDVMRLRFSQISEIIITNPEERIQQIIDFCKENSIERYLRSEPHCFDITTHSIFDLLNQSKNQALVISGNQVLVKKSVLNYV